METITTRYGEIPVAGFVERFDNGEVMCCSPAGKVTLHTPCGPLIPQFTTDDLRRRTVQSLSFHPSGALRAVPLENATQIDTPAGRMTVELVTFHPDGSLCRAFPLNGKLSGYWTQEDEGRLAAPVRLQTPLGTIEKKIIGVYFDPQGRLLSLTLWPGETLAAPTPAGVIAARVGVSFTPEGRLRSIEPAKPHPVSTPAGVIQAYDLDAVGICGDANSLVFSDEGAVARVRTNLTSVIARGADGGERTFRPELRESLCGDGDREITPLQLSFAPGVARIRARHDRPWTELDLSKWTLRAEPFVAQFATAFGRMACSC
jgi:hypothetical protein